METTHIGATTAARVSAPTEDELVAALWAREVRVFPKTRVSRSLSDGELIWGLMTSTEARFQLALIPLLLGRPTCDAAVDQILDVLSPSQRATLAFYYQAACYIQVLERDQLIVEHLLQDRFSAELSLPVASDIQDKPIQLEGALQATARLQAMTTGLDLNWLEAYKKAAKFVVGKHRNASSPHRTQSRH